MAVQVVPNGTLFGFYRALVVDDKDPKKTGRVKVHIPDIMPDKGWALQWCTDGLWAHPGNNMLGGRNTYDIDGPRCSLPDARYQGQCMIPPKGSHVFIVFEKGDPNRPYYVAAADYGQTKVLAENRCGPEYQKKWTLIKTHEGRACVYSDDPYDARVEITGKKRNIYNSPDGDTVTVYNIDGNQTVFLIDERPGHEKVFLKDYRGNYIKAIQDENGINDQLHVFFKDDIHIETLKNIYVRAHESIHVTADQDIYITAMQNMYTYVQLHFSEMANLIDRYSKTKDNRYAGTDINDLAMVNAARKAGASIKDMAGGNSSRSAGGFISDGAGGSMSLQCAGTMSVKGASTFVDGNPTSINNGSAPIPPEKGLEAAVTTPMATPPTPDPDRHFTPTDDGWAPVAPDENPQNKCHVKFWKPQYNWTSISQCHNAKVGGSGCGAAPGGGGGGGGGGCCSSSTSPAASAACSSCAGAVSSNVAASAASAIQSTARAAGEITSAVSVNSAINAVVNGTANLALDAASCAGIATNAAVDAASAVANAVGNQIGNVVDCVQDVTGGVADIIDPSLKNRALLVMASTLSDKAQRIMDKMFYGQPIAGAVADAAISTALAPLEVALGDALYAAGAITQATVTDCLQNVLMTNSGVVGGLTTLVSGTIGGFVSNVTAPATSALRTTIINYPELTLDVGSSIVASTAQRITSDVANAVGTVIGSAVSAAWYGTGLADAASALTNTASAAGSVMGNYYNAYATGMVMSQSSIDNAVGSFTGYWGTPSFMDNINRCCNDSFYDVTSASRDFCAGIVSGAMSGVVLATDAVAGAVIGGLVNHCIGTKNNILTGISNDLGGVIDGIVTTLDSTCAPYDFVDGIVPYYHNSVDPVFSNEFTSYATNALVSFDPVSITSAVTANVANAIGTVVGSAFGNLGYDVINCITGNMVTVDNLMGCINYTPIDAALDTVYSSLLTPAYMAESIATGYGNYLVSEACNSVYNNSIASIDPESFAIGYDMLCGYGLNGEGVSAMIGAAVGSAIGGTGTSTAAINAAAAIVNGTIWTGINSAEIILDSAGLPVNPVPLTDYLLSNLCSVMNGVVMDCNDIFYDKMTPMLDDHYVAPLTGPIATSLVNNFNYGVATKINDINSGLAALSNATCGSDDSAPMDGVKDCCNDAIDSVLKNVIPQKQGEPSNIIKDIPEIVSKSVSDENYDVEEAVKKITDSYAEEANVETLKRFQDFDSDKCVEETQKSVNDTLNNIIRPLEDPLNVTGNMLYTQITHELDAGFEKCSMSESVVNTVRGDCYTICSDCSTELIKRVVVEECKSQFSELETMCRTCAPAEWNSTQIMRCKELCDQVNKKMTQVVSDSNYLFKEELKLGLAEEVKKYCKDSIETKVISKDKVKEEITSDLRVHASEIANNFKQICTDNIILTENTKDNEFSQNVDLTEVYSIPGETSSKHKCSEEDTDPVWCDPEIIGGCGCCYEYMLFLKYKFFQTILPIVYNDGIKTIGVSLNPNMEKLTDTESVLHDDEIMSAYNSLVDHFFKDETIDITNNPYLKRIDEFMTECESLDCTVVVNLLDFSCSNYKWLNGLTEIEKYTHEITDERFLNFISTLIEHVYFKDDNGSKKQRICRIVLNLGNRSYDNTDDVDREKFDMYPNCGYIRELVMHLCYKCGVSSNYMSIPANDSDNLYYYSPYSEFKSYDEDKTHNLQDYEICTRDFVDEKTNGRADAIKYGSDGKIVGGYFKYYSDCMQKSYVMSYINDLMSWCEDTYGVNQTVLQHYTYDGNKVDSNIMNVIFSPNARKAMRYAYKGHKRYFKHVDCEFNPDTGDML